MPDQPDHAELLRFINMLADRARVETLPRFRSGVEVASKGERFDPVTMADREAERVLRQHIAEVYPAHGVIGEEFGSSNAGASHRWVLDPVDGTRAFISGGASWATLISFEVDEVPVLSLIDQPFTDERWIGWTDGALYRLRGVQRAAGTSRLDALSKARVATTDPRSSGYFSAREAAAFERLAARARLARFSLDAYAYGLLAIGEIDVVAETGLKRHDFSALAPVVLGAGGVISNWCGAPVGSDDRGEVLASASPALHETALLALSGA